MDVIGELTTAQTVARVARDVLDAGLNITDYLTVENGLYGNKVLLKAQPFPQVLVWR